LGFSTTTDNNEIIFIRVYHTIYSGRSLFNPVGKSQIKQSERVRFC